MYCIHNKQDRGAMDVQRTAFQECTRSCYSISQNCVITCLQVYISKVNVQFKFTTSVLLYCPSIYNKVCRVQDRSVVPETPGLKNENCNSNFHCSHYSQSFYANT